MLQAWTYDSFSEKKNVDSWRVIVALHDNGLKRVVCVCACVRASSNALDNNNRKSCDR